MAIYNKNQATVSQNQTKDCSQLSKEDNDVLSQEHNLSAALKPRVLGEYYRPKQTPNLLFNSKSSNFHPNLRKIALNSASDKFCIHPYCKLSHKLSR